MSEQVFTLFKSSRTHMMLACTLSEPAPGLPPGKQGVLSVRSQQNFLSKFSKQVTGVITLEDGELPPTCRQMHPTCRQMRAHTRFCLD